MAAPLIGIKFSSTDAIGRVLAGGKLYTYAAGTLNPQATYTSQSLASPNTNPVILDSAGRANVWLGPYPYRFRLTDASGALAPDGDIDNYQAPTSSIQLTQPTTDRFVGNGTQTTWTLSANPANVNNVFVSLGGAVQVPGDDYTLSGLSIIFTSPPPAGVVWFANYVVALPVGTVRADQMDFDPSIDGTPPGKVAYKLRAYRDSRDIPSIRHDGTADATAGLQQLLDYAWIALYYQSGTWVGVDVGGANPVVKIAPGRFKLAATSAALLLATGSALSGLGDPANTTSHTVLVRDSTGTAPAAGDGRGTPIIKLTRATKNGAALANAAWTGAISNLEFAAVTMGNNFDLPRSGAAIPRQAYPTGGSIYIDVDVTDGRISNVCFQHGACGVRGVGVGKTPAMRGDGFMGSTGINLYFKDVEFDAAALHVWFENCHLDVEFDNCQFYGGCSLFVGCTGRVVFQSNCRFYGGAYVDAASGASNDWDEFVCDARFEAPLTTYALGVFGARFLSVEAKIRGATGQSGIIAVACRGGRVAPVIQDSGYNAVPWPPSSGSADPVGALRLIGCQDLVIEGEIGTVATGGAWNQFAIISQDGVDAPTWGTALPSRVIFKGAIVTGAYNGATYRGQTRNLNVAAGDVVLSSYTNQRPGEERSSTGLSMRGMTLNGPVLLGQVYTYDLAAAIVESGLYLVTVETQLDANRAQINLGTFFVARRAAGGIVVQALSISNPSGASGAISLSGAVVSVNYSAGYAYQLTVRANKLADNGVE